MSRREVLLRGTATATVASSLFLPGVGHAARAGSYRVIETQAGKLRGRVRDGVATFNGINYAASTAGANRFMPPQPVRPWSGVRDALKLGNQCPQTNPDYPAWVDNTPKSEDCLVLNVCTPGSADRSAKLPVIVWLHGGGYTFGSASASLYDGANIARYGNVVSVGINHRIGIFGYTYLGADANSPFGSAGNAGQLDIVAALTWIRDNIEAFGGDPANVTVFGESGGGLKISVLMAMPSAKGLFHKAIIQSGSQMLVRTPEQAMPYTRQMYDILGVKDGDFAALQRVPMERLVACGDQVLSKQLTEMTPYIFNFAPVVDGHIIPDQPWKTKASDLSHDVPMIIGSNLHEGVTFIGANPAGFIGDDQVMAANAAKFNVLNDVTPEQVATLLPTYRKIMPTLADPDLLVRIITDIGFWRNAVQQAERKVEDGRAPAYVYECAWKTPCFGGEWALHGVEIPFVFHTDQYGTAWDGKDDDRKRAAADPQNLRLKVMDQMFGAWMNFARTGNPSTPALAWPKYDKQSRPTMVFDAHSQVVNDLRGTIREKVTAL